MIARLLRSVDFERVLRTRTRASTVHFALHHVPERPSAFVKRRAKPVPAKLSTGQPDGILQVVDDLPIPVPPDAVWLGTVVPKRHAKRAVTRTLLKRQIRCVVDEQQAALSAGLWVVRLRAPFDARSFVSAASDALKRAARDELAGLLATASQRRSGR